MGESGEGYNQGEKGDKRKRGGCKVGIGLGVFDVAWERVRRKGVGGGPFQRRG